MPSKAELISQLEIPGIIAVIRARSAEQVPAICEALLAGGVRALEITLSTPNAIAAIRDTCARFGDRALVGVGTVLAAEPCRAALAWHRERPVGPPLVRDLLAQRQR